MFPLGLVHLPVLTGPKFSKGFFFLVFEFFFSFNAWVSVNKVLGKRVYVQLFSKTSGPLVQARMQHVLSMQYLLHC